MTGANIGVLNVLTKGRTWKLPSCGAKPGHEPLSNTSAMVGRWRRKLGAFDLLTDTIWKGVEERFYLESLGSDRYRIKRSQRDR